ncbi:DUF6731 family protein [Thiococcus pfennigii]|uniref:DUF6731 family protein n=1 Tax=Thiococcus pfennigii TaxID=1057 RepID=UPI001904CBDC|nr:DUF6731 family protein [Thiococcus pfennigii]
MDADVRTITIDFFSGKLRPKNKKQGTDYSDLTVSSIFRKIALQDQPPAHENGPYLFEIRRLILSGKRYFGEFIKLRRDQIPLAGAPGGSERDLELEEQEGLLEKNFFSYYPDHELLLFHKNGHASSASRLAWYLSKFSEPRVVFDSILQPDPLRRLMRGDLNPRSLEIRFAPPSNADFFPAETWNRKILEILNGSAGISMHLHIRGDGKSRDPTRRFLSKDMKRAVAELCELGALKKAQVTLEEQDTEELIPLDLIHDRMYSIQDVEKQGRYFVPTAMRVALDNAYHEKRDQIIEIFGSDQDKLA